MENKPLFCPKCKGELKQSYSFDIYDVFKEIQGTIYFRVCFNCEARDGFPTLWTKDKKLVKPTLEMDCLTEEQLKKKDFYDSVVNWFGDAIEKVYDKNKQTPSFCFAEGEDGNKLTPEEMQKEENLCALFGPYHKEVIAELERKDAELIKAYQHTAKPCENCGKMVTIVEAHMCKKHDTDWINFSDRKPEVGQSITIAETPKGRIHLNIKYSPSEDKQLLRDEWKWWKPYNKPAQQESKQEECEHEWGEPGEFTLCEIQDGEPIPLAEYKNTHRYCRKCSKPKPNDAEKSQSQIAIDKVIEALDKLGLISPRNDAGLAANNYFYTFREKLKELNK